MAVCLTSRYRGLAVLVRSYSSPFVMRQRYSYEMNQSHRHPSQNRSRLPNGS